MAEIKKAAEAAAMGEIPDCYPTSTVAHERRAVKRNFRKARVTGLKARGD
jgi:hypothetical protein